MGDHVFAITVSPRDGDVWIGSDMGIARYSEKRQDWDYYTRASGLPSDQIQGIAFGGDGKVYVGTQCDGIALAGPGDDYKKWRTVTAPAKMPAAVFGKGLPSNLINNLESIGPVAGHSLVVAMTPSGAALTENGDEWMFLRGEDWKDHTPGPYEANPDIDKEKRPAEDWITALGTDGVAVWTGYRKAGVESSKLGVAGLDVGVSAANVAKGSVIIRAILALPEQPPLFAAYDDVAGGLLTLDNAPAFKLAARIPVVRGPEPFPASPPMPAADDAHALASRLEKLNGRIAPGEAFYLADDWRTQGDWVGRYGSGFAKLCGIGQNGDQDYSLQPGYEVSLDVGPHHEAGAENLGWYHSNETTDDLRFLYDPTLGHRRDAEDNDGSYDGKIYPETYDGPGLLVKAAVPRGVHYLSLYFVNDDAHTKGGNKYRDYDVQIYSDLNNSGNVQMDAPLARTRVTDFWGGVYKQFFVCGPAHYVVRIGRNRSFVTKLQGIFLDPVTEALTDNPAVLPGFDAVPYQAPDEPENAQYSPLAQAAVDLWKQMDDDLGLRGAINLQMPYRIWSYRAAVAGQAPPELLEHWRWQISIWTQDDRAKFDQSVKAAHDAAGAAK
jgi:hypothetical protein